MTRTIINLTILPLLLFAGSPKLRLGYFNHSMFEVVLPSGIRIITDPFDLTTGPDFPIGITADVVVMSHDHFDHNYSTGVGGSPTRIAWTSGSALGIDFTATPTKHSPAGTEGSNHIISWEAGGLKFNHMGDYGDVLSAGDSTLLAQSAFLFIPVGGGPTIDAGDANDLLDRVRPTVAFPMHYRTPDHSTGFSTLATLEQANTSFTFQVVTKEAWIAVDPDRLPSGTVIWEPDYSAELPGDLEAKGISVLDLSPAPYQINFEVKNNAGRPALDAPLILTIYDSTSLIQAETTLISLSAGEDKEFSFAFSPSATNRYTITGEVVYPADEVPPNDTVSIEVDFTAITESKPAPAPKLNAHWLADGLLSIEYVVEKEKSTVALYDANGRVIKRFDVNQASTGRIRWQPEQPLAHGVYFAHMSTAHGSLTQKLVLLRSANR